MTSPSLPSERPGHAVRQRGVAETFGHALSILVWLPLALLFTYIALFA